MDFRCRLLAFLWASAEPTTSSMKEKEKTLLHMVGWSGASITAETLERTECVKRLIGRALRRMLAERKSTSRLAKKSFSAIYFVFLQQHNRRICY